MANTVLVPVFTGDIQNTAVQLCDARTLHTFMQVRRDFSNWIKGRIAKFGFVQEVDYLSISRSPELASGNRGAAIDYHLTLDMAKELAMVENNAKGREVRRYFIECERRAHQPATITPAQQQHLKELVDLVAESGRQTHGETWARLHRQFGIPRYTELPAAQFDTACQYLRGKLDTPSIAQLMQKHLPQSLPTFRRRRFLVSIDDEGREAIQPVPDDAAVASRADWPRLIRDPDFCASPDELRDIMSACFDRMAAMHAASQKTAVIMCQRIQNTAPKIMPR